MRVCFWGQIRDRGPYSSAADSCKIGASLCIIRRQTHNVITEEEPLFTLIEGFHSFEYLSFGKLWKGSLCRSLKLLPGTRSEHFDQATQMHFIFRQWIPHVFQCPFCIYSLQLSAFLAVLLRHNILQTVAHSSTSIIPL